LLVKPTTPINAINTRTLKRKYFIAMLTFHLANNNNEWYEHVPKSAETSQGGKVTIL